MLKFVKMIFSDIIKFLKGIFSNNFKIINSNKGVKKNNNNGIIQTGDSNNANIKK